MAGTLGYFVLGIYLQRKWPPSSLLFGFFLSAAIITAVSTYLMTFQFATYNKQYFFFEYTSASVILTAIPLFLILCKARPDWPETKNTFIRRTIEAISKNTLPIYLLHVIILETLQRGYLGFKLSLTAIDPLIGIPIIATVTLFSTLGIILLTKKVPVLRTLIG